MESVKKGCERPSGDPLLRASQGLKRTLGSAVQDGIRGGSEEKGRGLSGFVEKPGGLQDGLAADPVAALLDRLPVGKMDTPPQERPKLFFQLQEVALPGLLSPGSEPNQKIEIALWSELASDCRAEDGELLDAAPLAEASNRFERKVWKLGFGQTFALSPHRSQSLSTRPSSARNPTTTLPWWGREEDSCVFA